MSFQEVDQQYIELKRQYDSGALTADAFDAKLKEMMVQDAQGHWWAKNRATGEWAYYDGIKWIMSAPPSPAIITPQPPVVSGKPISKGVAIVFYILSFLFSIAGLVIFLVYRNKPFESDRKMANACGILALVGLVLYIIVQAA